MASGEAALEGAAPAGVLVWETVARRRGELPAAPIAYCARLWAVTTDGAGGRAGTIRPRDSFREGLAAELPGSPAAAAVRLRRARVLGARPSTEKACDAATIEAATALVLFGAPRTEVDATATPSLQPANAAAPATYAEAALLWRPWDQLRRPAVRRARASVAEQPVAFAARSTVVDTAAVSAAGPLVGAAVRPARPLAAGVCAGPDAQGQRLSPQRRAVTLEGERPSSGFLPAVTYSRVLARKNPANGRKCKGDGNNEAPAGGMGSGRSWTEAEDCALARAYAAVVVDNSNGADQTKADLWMKVYHAYKILVGEKDLPDNEVSWTARALEGRWPTVAQGVDAFKDAYRCVRDQNLTGNLEEQGLISAATAVIYGMGAYAGVREDRDKDKKKGKSCVRKPKEATCDFVGCWKALRHLDKFSGAAAADATPLPPPPPPSLATAEESGAEDSDVLVKAPPKTGAYAPAPLGVKAAKRDRSEARSVARAAAMESAKSADALESIARSAAARAQIAFFFSPHTADSAATAVFKKRETMVLLGKAAEKHGDDSASDDESEPYRKKRLAIRAVRTPTSTRGVTDISSSCSAAVTPVRVRVRCGMKGLTRTSTPTDTRDTAGRRAVDKDPTPVTRLMMDSDSDVQVVQEARIAPRNLRRTMRRARRPVACICPGPMALRRLLCWSRRLSTPHCHCPLNPCASLLCKLLDWRLGQPSSPRRWPHLPCAICHAAPRRSAPRRRCPRGRRSRSRPRLSTST